MEKRSQREISRLLGVSRKTIRKYCEGNVFPDTKTNIKRKSQLRQAVEPIIIELIEKNKTQPKKQRLDAKSIWLILTEKKGFSIGQSTVRRYVREIKEEKPEIFIPLAFQPGEAMQIDWGEAYAYIDSVKRKISYFCAVLNYSKAIHVSVYPDKSTESFFMAHVKAFEFFGGVPYTCIYDNLKTAVIKGSGKKAVRQERFKKLEAHYAFTSVFCNVAAGWEKGLVENLVATARKLALTPMPRVKDFEELQNIVTEKCIDYYQNHKLRYYNKTIKEMFSEDKKKLLKLPAVPLDTAKIVTTRVYSDLTLHYQGIKYSVPAALAGKKVTLRVTPFKVYIYFQGKMIYCHKKAQKKNDHQYIPEHYLQLLERKPGAIDHAKPLKQGIMPEELIDFKKLCSEKDKNQQLVSILKLAENIEKDKLLWAVKMANQSRSPNYSLVCFYLDIQDEKVNTQEFESSVKVEKVDLTQYDKLMLKGDNGNENN